MSETAARLLDLTAQIVSAQCRQGDLSPDALPDLIRQVHQTLATLGSPDAAGRPEEPAGDLKPAVPIKKSVFPDYIVCLEDGQKLKMLKRHLQATYGMSPDDYRKRWGLPASYPMVSPNYAEKRSALARKIGLGRSRDAATEIEEPAPEVDPVPIPEEAEVGVQVLPERKRGRKKLAA